ncbi:dihydrodipicolinate synthase family protein [Luteolibacter arcticus]|uniref:Dihydrodipicolinate synthase family protein n=1 Tax=Luteolibacter arcticus TaxID=1581411 RepID=A0ABT3GQL9_9BACT|nr:dihydrodipicolinate synthase family protein [Luteolibacter arcticus]MCW1925766.1 dihydrodipicolinate synthase family protein [Luteolibacter arcticus]
MNPQPLHELVVATHSPFHADGSLAPEVVPFQAAFLAANGIRTVFITGSTGESHSLTCAERLALYDAWATAGPEHGLRVIAHVGSNCVEDAKALARRAEKHGFSAISALAPSYYKPGSLTALIDCCAAIAADAPMTPFYYYDIPALTGVSFPMERFLVEAPARIPTLAGIKFTNPDLVSYRRSLEVAGRLDLPWGVDETLLSALAAGAKGGVGSTYNWAPELYRNLIAAHARGDFEEARRLQSISIAMVDAIAATGFLGTAKALMERLGVPVGPARLPLGNPSAAQVDVLMEQLESLGFAAWGARALEVALP